VDACFIRLTLPAQTVKVTVFSVLRVVFLNACSTESQLALLLLLEWPMVEGVTV
jgi:hypothetical protein